ncbi:MAG: hypothetical protein KDJ54_19345 [Candidatus Competibacteraceae bacterium]|nr:hypothetical protein [Candidatus Competibacteraceae bacterium]
MKLTKLALGATITSLLLLLALSNSAAAEGTSDTASPEARSVPLLQVGESMTPERRAILRYDPSYISSLRVPPPPELALQQQRLMAAQATITVNFLPASVVDGDNCLIWPEQPKAAFSYAANLWASQLQSPVPITIDACWANNLPAGVLGHGGPNNFVRNFTGAPVINTWYSVPAANALHGSDLDPVQADMYSAYSSTFNWYFGTDGNTPPTQVDFASVVLHEITHGLGFLGSMQISGGLGSWGGGTGFPIIYDRFTEDGSGQKLLDTTLFPNFSVVLATQLISNDIYFNGTYANAGNGGARVPLYAPAIWSPGSSYAHLAENYNNTPNALMTYSLPSGESIHSPGPVTLGLLKDVGWTLQQASDNYTLTLAKAGTGNGTVSGGGSYPAGATVNLTATPDANSTFAGWSPSPCAPSFPMPASNLSCIATFNAGSPSATSRLVNIATRDWVGTGDNVMIAGFIIGGSSPKQVLIEATGPSMTSAGVPNVLRDPTLTLYSGQTVIASNDNWQNSPTAAAIQATGLAPSNPSESAILITLNPGPYTAIVRGVSDTTGNALVAVFELSNPSAPLINISTRGRTETGDNVMIAGFVIGGSSPQQVLVRAFGPTLTTAGVPGALADPTLTLYSGQTVLASNDNWQDSQAAAIQATGLAPSNPSESAILITLPPGPYTAIVRGFNNSVGNTLVAVDEPY